MVKSRVPVCKSKRGDGTLYLFAWNGLREKYKELHKSGVVLDFTEYLDHLRRILKKPFPGKREVEKYVPAGYGVREKYIQILERIGGMPEDETSRKVLFRMGSGSEYEEYQNRTEKVLEHLKFLEKTC